MFRRSLIAAATAATLALGLTAAAPDAEARHRRHHSGEVNIFFGFPGSYGGNYGYYDDDWGYSNRHHRYHRSNYHCHWVKVKKKHHKWRKVKRCHNAWHGDRW